MCFRVSFFLPHFFRPLKNACSLSFPSPLRSYLFQVFQGHVGAEGAIGQRPNATEVMVGEMAETLPEYVACVEAQVDFTEHKGQVTAYISGAEQRRMIQGAEERLVARAEGRQGMGKAGPRPELECVHVAVQEQVACIKGKTTTVRRTQELGRIKGVLQLVARQSRVWRYTDGEGKLKSGVVWELDCIHATSSEAPAAGIYQLSPATPDLTSLENGGEP